MKFAILDPLWPHFDLFRRLPTLPPPPQPPLDDDDENLNLSDPVSPPSSLPQPSPPPTKKQVSVLSFGAWVTFGEQVDVLAATKIMQRARDAGVNFFDNAEVYGGGEAERVMGEALRELGWPRSSFVLSTKVFWGGSGPNDTGLSRKHVVEALDASLERLGVGYVDVFLAHRPDPDTPVEETVRAFNHVIEQGKALYWGTSEWSAAVREECSGGERGREGREKETKKKKNEEKRPPPPPPPLPPPPPGALSSKPSRPRSSRASRARSPGGVYSSRRASQGQARAVPLGPQPAAVAVQDAPPFAAGYALLEKTFFAHHPPSTSTTPRRKIKLEFKNVRPPPTPPTANRGRVGRCRPPGTHRALLRAAAVQPPRARQGRGRVFAAL